jgi:protein TonB
MNYLLGALVCASLPLSPAAAQQVISPLKQEFLDSTRHVLPSAAGAYYRRETEYTDSTAGVLRNYFASNGQLQSRGTYENIRLEVANGVFETWYASGQLESRAEFSHGKYEGEVREYYPSGKPKRQEHYAANKLTSSKCFELDGRPMECSPLVYVEVMPVYPEGDGGDRAIMAAVARNFRYPRQAIKANSKGRILVKFAVNEQGIVTDAQLVEGLTPEIDAAAIQAVQKLRRFKPGTQQGKPVKVYFTVPLNLAIK